MNKKLHDWVLMFLGTVLVSVGVYFFKLPNGFSTGGVSGLAAVLAKLMPGTSAATLIVVMNFALLLAGFVVLGKDFGVRTAVCSVGFTAITWLLERLVPLSGTLTDQPFLELVYAMLLTSVGSAILFEQQASSGGTDIVALILKKYTLADTGRALLLSDTLIALSSFFVFGVQTGLYSLLGLFAKAFLVDTVIEDMNLCKCFTIITEKPEPICRYILEDMHHGVTETDSVGAFTGREKKMLLVVCRRIEGVRLRRRVRELDPRAFLIITNTSEIIGRGFRQV